MRAILCVGVVAFAVLPVAAERRLQLGASVNIPLRLLLKQPTAVIFPEPIDSIATQLVEHDKTVPAQMREPDPYSVTYDGPKMFIVPFDPTLDTRIFVNGKGGTLYMVLLKIGSPADDIVHVVRGAEKAKPVAFDLDSMIRLLQAGGTVPGQQPSDLATPAVTDPRMQLVSASGTSVGGWHGQCLLPGRAFR